MNEEIIRKLFKSVCGPLVQHQGMLAQIWQVKGVQKTEIKDKGDPKRQIVEFCIKLFIGFSYA